MEKIHLMQTIVREDAISSTDVRNVVHEEITKKVTDFLEANEINPDEKGFDWALSKKMTEEIFSDNWLMRNGSDFCIRVVNDDEDIDEIRDGLEISSVNQNEDYQEFQMNELDRDAAFEMGLLDSIDREQYMTDHRDVGGPKWDYTYSDYVITVNGRKIIVGFLIHDDYNKDTVHSYLTNKIIWSDIWSRKEDMYYDTVKEFIDDFCNHYHPRYVDIFIDTNDEKCVMPENDIEKPEDIDFNLVIGDDEDMQSNNARWGIVAMWE